MKRMTKLFNLSMAAALVFALVFALILPGATQAQGGGTIKSASYGTTSDGKAVREYTLTNANGMEVKIITYGGIITSVKVPDRSKKMANVALGLTSWPTMKPKIARISGPSSGAMETALPKAGSPWMVLPTAWMQTMG